MAFVLDGTGRLSRSAGLISSTANFQKLFAVLRTGSQPGNRYMATLRSATDGHDICINNPGAGAGYAPILFANFSTVVGPLSAHPLNEYWWVAIGGTNGAITIRTVKHALTNWVSASGAQAPFVPVADHYGDSGDGTQTYAAKYAYLFEWSSERTIEELTAQIASATPIVTSGLVLYKSGIGQNLAQALQGGVGAALTAVGGVTLDATGPAFGPVITGTIEIPATASIDLAAPVIEQIAISGSTALIRVGNIDPNTAVIELTRAPDVAGAPGSTGRVVTTHPVTPQEAAAGLKIIEITGHLTTATYHYRAVAQRGSNSSTPSPWFAVTFNTTVAIGAIEAPDVASMALSVRLGIEIVCQEKPDFAVDNIGPVITVFAPLVVNVAGAYNVTASATDLTGVQLIRFSRDGTTLQTFQGPGPHTVQEMATFADNGTRAYQVTAIDLGGNTSTVTKEVTINILQGEFAVTLAPSTATVTAPGILELTAGVPGGQPIQEVLFIENGFPLGQAITQAPFSRGVQLFTAQDNGTRNYQARVTLTDGRVGFSPVVTVIVNIPPAARTLVIATGLADIMEIPRQDTSRAIMFRLEDAATGAPLVGATARVLIAHADGAFVEPLGPVAEFGIPGFYGYWPAAEDVNEDGAFQIAPSAPNAKPVPIINARVVTPYGKR
ncbi:MAG: hypothetical protein AB7G13_28755 [Lautropia sp.]